MPDREDVALMFHLMRRAGFGATYDEVEQLAVQGYEATVEQLLNPENVPSNSSVPWPPLPSIGSLQVGSPTSSVL